VIFDEMPTDADLLQTLLAEFTEDIHDVLERFRYLAAIENDVPAPDGRIIYGGRVTYLSYVEARRSYIVGNFVATILLCQATLENLLAAFMHAMGLEVPQKASLKWTLAACDTNSG
jgi:hypothetical protein